MKKILPIINNSGEQLNLCSLPKPSQTRKLLLEGGETITSQGKNAEILKSLTAVNILKIPELRARNSKF